MVLFRQATDDVYEEEEEEEEDNDDRLQVVIDTSYSISNI